MGQVCCSGRAKEELHDLDGKVVDFRPTVPEFRGETNSLPPPATSMTIQPISASAARAEGGGATKSKEPAMAEAPRSVTYVARTAPTGYTGAVSAVPGQVTYGAPVTYTGSQRSLGSGRVTYGAPRQYRHVSKVSYSAPPTSVSMMPNASFDMEKNGEGVNLMSPGKGSNASA
eukprot:g20453.t1